MQKVPSQSYRLIRWKMITESMILKILVERLRKSYGIPPSGVTLLGKSLEEGLLQARELKDKIGEKKLRVIFKLASKLLVERWQLEDYVFFDTIDAPYASGVRIVYNSSKDIVEPGVYLKIDSYTSAKELGEIFKHIKPFVKGTMAPIVYKTKKRKKSKSLDTEKELEIYKMVEAKIQKSYKEKVALRNSRDELKQESFERIVSNAFDDLAVDEVPDRLQEDEETEWIAKRHKQIETSYYHTTERYGVPTLRDLFSFLRVISNI